MKQFSLVLNILLVIAVGVLYYLHFAHDKLLPKGSITEGYKQKDSCGDKISIVAYVELDSLYSNVTFIKLRKRELEAEQKTIAQEYESRYRSLSAEKDEFLKKGNAITQQEAEAFQAKLGQKQQDIEADKQTKAQRLAEKGAKIMEDMQSKVRAFMKEYNKSKNYSYILATGTGLDYLFYKDSALNITPDVIKGLNEQMNETAKQ
ncbi:MAG: OmpH family outer membrane protein [Ferruginibacter sp.]|nr:OmpH family outer membrane protein [Ferruginibacter sp.]